MSNFKTFLNLLTEEPPSVYHESVEDFVIIKHNINEFELEFRLNYNVSVPYFLPADTSNPEEFELEFENTDIDEIELSEAGEFVELSNTELNSIYEILYKQLIN